MHELNSGLAIAATTILLLGLASGFIKQRLWISEPLVAIVVGVLAGPHFLNIAAIEVPDQQRNFLLLEFARITLAISVMGAALRLPTRWELHNWRDLVVLFGLGMPLMWAVGATLAWLVLGLPLLYALLVGAALSPTDPVLSDSIITGGTAEENVPLRMRAALTAESGANDGLAILLVMVPVLLLTSTSQGIARDWFVQILVREVLAGAAFGVIVGWLAARAFVWVLRREASEHPSILTLALALSLAVAALGVILHFTALLAVFSAGIAFNRASTVHQEAWHENMQDAVARFFDIPIFVLLGAMLPWDGWAGLGWRGVGFAVAVLLLRRMPAWLLLRPLLRSVRTPLEAAFNGWFGPIGIAAVFYAMYLQPRIDNGGLVWNIVSLVVFSSIVLHGITATPLTRGFGRLVGAARAREEAEASPEERAEEAEEDQARRVREEATEEELKEAGEEGEDGSRRGDRAADTRSL